MPDISGRVPSRTTPGRRNRRYWGVIAMLAGVTLFSFLLLGFNPLTIWLALLTLLLLFAPDLV